MQGLLFHCTQALSCQQNSQALHYHLEAANSQPGRYRTNACGEPPLAPLASTLALCSHREQTRSASPELTASSRRVLPGWPRRRAARPPLMSRKRRRGSPEGGCAPRGCRKPSSRATCSPPPPSCSSWYSEVNTSCWLLLFTYDTCTNQGPRREILQVKRSSEISKIFDLFGFSQRRGNKPYKCDTLDNHANKEFS